MANSVLSTTTATRIGAGKFNRRITIQEPSGPTTATGGQTRAWTDVVSTWAWIEPWKGQEKLLADQVYLGKWVVVLIRYRPSMNISAIMRVKYGTQTYNIRSVTVPSEARSSLVMVCEELQAEGSLH